MKIEHFEITWDCLHERGVAWYAIEISATCAPNGDKTDVGAYDGNGSLPDVSPTLETDIIQQFIDGAPRIELLVCDGAGGQKWLVFPIGQLVRPKISEYEVSEKSYHPVGGGRSYKYESDARHGYWDAQWNAYATELDDVLEFSVKPEHLALMRHIKIIKGKREYTHNPVAFGAWRWLFGTSEVYADVCRILNNGWDAKSLSRAQRHRIDLLLLELRVCAQIMFHNLSIQHGMYNKINGVWQPIFVYKTFETNHP